MINRVETIHSLFNIQFNQLFITKLQEINAIYGQQQLENIKNTLGLIRELKMLNIEYNLLNYNPNLFSRKTMEPGWVWIMELSRKILNIGTSPLHLSTPMMW